MLVTSFNTPPPSSIPAGYLQDGRHRHHDENERGRPDTPAEGGQDLLQDGQEQRRPDLAGRVQRGGQERPLHRITAAVRPPEIGEQRAPRTSCHGLHRENFMFHSVCSYFHWKKTQQQQKKKTTKDEKKMLGLLPLNGSASCVWNTRVHENVHLL